MKDSKRAKRLAEKRAKKAQKIGKPGYNSNYAKKRRYLEAHGKWGFEIPSPKPWK